MMLWSLLIYPFFITVHVGSVLLALGVYQTLFVDAGSVTAFFATLDPTHAPVMLAGILPLLNGSVTFFLVYHEERPGLWGLFKLWLCLLIQVDLLLIGSTLAALYIADALTAGDCLLDPETEATVALCFVLGLLVLQAKVSQFWAFLTSSPEPERGSWVLPLKVARRYR